MSDWLWRWEFWVISGLVLAFCAAVEWGVRREIRGEKRASERLDRQADKLP
jgi:hypothetical protein